MRFKQVKKRGYARLYHATGPGFHYSIGGLPGSFAVYFAPVEQALTFLGVFATLEQAKAAARQHYLNCTSQGGIA